MEVPRVLSMDSMLMVSVGTFEELAKDIKQHYMRLEKRKTVDTVNRYQSFAPIRYSCHARWFVDGKDYFEYLADLLETAESEIFITDWSMNPEIYLRRNSETAKPEDRLDLILQKQARKGVMIYILLWFEVDAAMKGSVNSQHTISHLHSLHPNIRVLRHPGGIGKVLWTHHQKTVIIDQQHAFVGGIDLCFGRYDRRDHPLSDTCHLNTQFPGKDYYNPYYKDLYNLHEPFLDIIDRASIPRMPWHDIHCYVDREAARDLATNFVERWNHHLQKKVDRYAVEVVGFPLLKVSLSPFLDSIQKKGTCSCQIVRSIGKWSCGQELTERSILNAYLDMIQNARHYIYIENQYFISVGNSLTETLFRRISEAIQRKEKFRVFILLPITPCGDWKLNNIKFVMKWQYDTISRGGASLLERLQKQFPKTTLSDYIGFYSLRKVDRLINTVVSDQVYIHSKLMIVDDSRVIIGSANYNDRSMLGDRDSEICIVVDDHEFVESRMGGKKFFAAKFAYDLRVSLFKEHLGIDTEEHSLMDPTCDETYSFWRHTANENTKLFCSMFPMFPRDFFTTTQQFVETERLMESMTADEKRKRNEANLLSYEKVKGHLIFFPTDFLKDEGLDSTFLTVEKLLPAYLFQ